MNLRNEIAVPQFLPLLRVWEITDLVWVAVVSEKMRVPLCCEDTSSSFFFKLITQTGDLNIDMTPAIIEDRHSGQVLRCYVARCLFKRLSPQRRLWCTLSIDLRSCDRPWSAGESIPRPKHRAPWTCCSEGLSSCKALLWDVSFYFCHSDMV